MGVTKSGIPLTRQPATRSVFLAIVYYSQIGDHPQEDLARFGYKLNMKLIFFKNILLLFWLPTWTMYRNLMFFLKFWLNSAHWKSQKAPDFIFNIAFWLYIASKIKPTNESMQITRYMTILFLRIEMPSFHPHKEHLWNFHPSSDRLHNHWANESPRWYLVLTSRPLLKWRLKVMGCNSWLNKVSRFSQMIVVV